MFPQHLFEFPPKVRRHAGQVDLRLTFPGVNMIMFPCFSPVMEWCSFAFLSVHAGISSNMILNNNKRVHQMH